MAKLDNRVGFAVSDVELEALELLSEFEDSQAALLRRLIRVEAKKTDIWDKAKLLVIDKYWEQAKENNDKFLT